MILGLLKCCPISNYTILHSLDKELHIKRGGEPVLSLRSPLLWILGASDSALAHCRTYCLELKKKTMYIECASHFVIKAHSNEK